MREKGDSTECFFVPKRLRTTAKYLCTETHMIKKTDLLGGDGVGTESKQTVSGCEGSSKFPV